jgi:hypothetical protein
MITTSINNTHIGLKREKIRKPFAVPKKIPRESSEARPFSKHSVSFMQFSGPYVIASQSSEIECSSWQLEKGQGRAATLRARATKTSPLSAVEMPFSTSALGSFLSTI